MNSSLHDVFELFKLSGKNKVAIIGKGPSLDQVDLTCLNDFFVININDSEKAYAGDIGMYRFEWVKEYLNDAIGRCTLYLTCNPLDQKNHIYIPSRHENPENHKPIQERFFDADFILEDAMIISALKLCNLIADNVRQKLDVYLLGFDFTLSSGFSLRSGGTVEFGEKEYVENVLHSQKAYLELLMTHESDLSISVNHIGSQTFSAMNTAQFNQRFDGNTTLVDFRSSISTTEVNKNKRDFQVKIVAEITTNHFGDLRLLKKMIKAAAESGADYIKLQKRDVETFYSQEELLKPYSSPFGETFRDYRNGLELDVFGFQMVEKWCQEYDIKWFASVLDLQSYQFVKQFDPEIIKLPSTISEHTDFLELVAKDFKGDVVLSTGMTDQSYEDFVLDKFKNCRNLYLLQCVSSYPTMNEDANVAVVRHYHELSRKYTHIIPGYSSHDVGSICSQLSVAAGALMVEKHVKYGNTPWAHFDNVAVDMLTDKFKIFVDDIRLAELCLGSNRKEVLSSEHHKYVIKVD
ncbi:N-acetylneuraminate synthase family protein [Vibrio mediterranei]|uniref:N-acetylneuraminate synthase family protein n=1 Tax=Vibrio mediterranei TaxID=689 RepID=UPI00148DFAD2|nr:N-acetylneuraminate synthase family protein [Vibrio mediterranei]NOI25401.1 N-acetylneuraminate synthase [Vibrio mediterranei]